MNRLLIRLGSVAIGVLAWTLRNTPAGFSKGLGRFLGWTWYRVIPIRRAVARENIEQALGLAGPDRERVVRAMYLHLGESFVEFLRFAGATDQQIPLRIEGREHLESALAAGRGVICVTAHLGNWELLMRGGRLVDAPVMVVSKMLRSPVAHALWMGVREGGAEIVFTEGSARQIVSHLGRNGVVGYVLDQHAPTTRAVWLPFMGRLAATSPDVVRLARMSSAVVLPVFIRRGLDGHYIDVGLPIDMPDTGDRRTDEIEGTRRCLVPVEAAIRGNPGQWLWIHRRWKAPPPGVAPTSSTENAQNMCQRAASS